MDTMENRKTVKVTCAIIERNGQILAAERSEEMGMAYKWEFPGGKVEKGEKAEDTIAREIKEELDVEVRVKEALTPKVHDYGINIIELIPFICEITCGNIECKEHRQFVWDFPENLRGLDWAEADVPIFNEYMEYIKQENM